MDAKTHCCVLIQHACAIYKTNNKAAPHSATHTAAMYMLCGSSLLREQQPVFCICRPSCQCKLTLIQLSEPELELVLCNNEIYLETHFARACSKNGRDPPSQNAARRCLARGPAGHVEVYG